MELQPIFGVILLFLIRAVLLALSQCSGCIEVDAQCIRALIWGRYQWRIQHFPGGGTIPKVGVLTYFLVENCMKMKGGSVPGASP